MKKNDYFMATCKDMSHDGQGIVKVDGFPYFVKGMIIGETGKLKVIKMLKNYGVCRLVERTNSSKYRVLPNCDIYKMCGGCHLQHINQAGQCYFKTKRVKDTLVKIGNCDVEVKDCLMMEEPWYYRNKVQVPVGYQGNTLVSGFYKQHTNDIIPCDHCYIQNKKSNQITTYFRSLMEQYHIEPYNKVTKKGNIRHILTKYGFQTNECMLVLITNERTIPHIDQIIKKLIQKFPELTTIIQNINQTNSNVILGQEEIILYGKGYIKDILLKNTYKISLKSFYQINPIQTEKLYTKAMELANLKQTDRVIDAYCGIGTISLSLSNYVKEVIGVEIVEEAIQDAKENAVMNDIDNVTFICKDAGEFMIELTSKKESIDVVFVDPPRKGCSHDFLTSLVTLSPKTVVYISCNVATQARDIKFLQEHGYHVDICQPVDLFPHTYHIESIVRLSYQKNAD